MSISEIIFYVLAVLSVISGIAVVSAKNPVHSVLFLIVTFFCIAGQYLLMNAQFLFVVQIIVYAGAIMVLFLFVLMLLNLSKETEPNKSNLMKMIATISAGLLMVTMVGAFRNSLELAPTNQAIEGMGLVKNLGKVLFKDFVVPFEVSSILFLAGMVGAVLLGKRDPQEKQEEA